MEFSAKWTSAAVCCIALVLATPSLAQRQRNFNGEVWPTLDTVAKYAWLNGYIAGLDTATVSAPFAMCSDAKDPQDCYVAASRKMEPYLLGNMRGIPLAQISDGLDAFYADYKNRRIEIQYATSYVARSIRGASADDLERQILLLRQEAVK